MQQIKTKELPADYFVTATYYPSGNVEFIVSWEVGGMYEVIGTKHIQLIGANVFPSGRNYTDEQIKMIFALSDSNTDYFIYKVTDIKGDKNETN